MCTMKIDEQSKSTNTRESNETPPKTESFCEKMRRLHANSLFFEEIKKRVGSSTRLSSGEGECTPKEEIAFYANALRAKLKKSFEKANIIEDAIEPQNKTNLFSENSSKMDAEKSEENVTERYNYLKEFAVPELTTLKNYLENPPAHSSITRTHMFAICFALEMTYADAENFFKNIYKDAFFTLQGSDVIFLHCLNASKAYTCMDVANLLLQLAKGTKEDLTSPADEEVIGVEESESKLSSSYKTGEIEQFLCTQELQDLLNYAIALDVKHKQYEKKHLAKLRDQTEIARKRKGLHLFQQDFCNEIKKLYDSCTLHGSSGVKRHIFGCKAKEAPIIKDIWSDILPDRLFRPSEFKFCTNFNKLRKLYIALHFYVLFYGKHCPDENVVLNYVGDINGLLAIYSLGGLTSDDPYDFLFLATIARVKESLGNRKQTAKYREFLSEENHESDSENITKYNPIEIIHSLLSGELDIPQTLEGEANE